MTKISGKMLNDKQIKIIAEEKVALENMIAYNVSSPFEKVRCLSLMAILSIENKRGFENTL